MFLNAAQLQSWTRALRFHKPLGVAKKKKEKENEITDPRNGNTDKLLIHLGIIPNTQEKTHMTVKILVSFKTKIQAQ